VTEEARVGETPTEGQRVAARAITKWYLAHHWGRGDDPGTAAMFTDPARVGAFASTVGDLARGEPSALFRLLVACTMFQRRQDQQILRVLRGVSEVDAHELTDIDHLVGLAKSSACPHLATSATLRGDCDLGKDPATGLGKCDQRPDLPCHLKRHTVLLKRYGHFGKVPTSAALMVRESGASDLADLYDQVRRSPMTPAERARALEATLCGAWRVSQKIAAMFLSAVSNPDLSPGIAPWAEGVDWTYFAVVDSNVDLFLAATGYQGRGTYDARREFMRQLALSIDLSAERPGLHAFNPRLVQQAIYLFMSVTNRRHLSHDCSHAGVSNCAQCPRPLSHLCASRKT